MAQLTLYIEQDGEINIVFFTQGQTGTRGEPGLPGDRGPSGEGKVGPPV